MEQNTLNRDREPILKVDMFGGFSMTYAGNQVAFARSSNTKFIQLLHLLFLNYGTGIAKKQLLDALYGWETDGNPNKNLNNVIYRLKRQLAAAGFPEEDYIVLENGICRWVSSFPVEVDAVRFGELMKAGDETAGGEQIEFYKMAEQLYRGEFLPQYSTEMWVIENSQYFKKDYERLVNRLIGWCEERQEYTEELRLIRKAARIYPYEEWQMREIDCLLTMKEYKSAYDVYQETSRLYCEDMGIPPGREMLERLRLIERQVTNPVGNFEDIRENFMEKEKEGAYYCPYPSFLDSCRLLARMAERGGQSVFLMLLSLTESRGKEFLDSDKRDCQMELLKQNVRCALRKGDLFTKYSNSQYLISLAGVERENCSCVFTRLQKNWKKTPGSRGELSYSVESLLKMMGPDVLPQMKEPDWGKKKGW